jgi:hypothetical protein
MKNYGCQIWLLSLCIILVCILWWTILLMTNKIIFRLFYIFKRRVLVLVPTRELAVQVHTVTRQLCQFTNVECCLAVGMFICVTMKLCLSCDVMNSRQTVKHEVMPLEEHVDVFLSVSLWKSGMEMIRLFITH